MLGIVMTDDGNIVELGKAIEKAVAKVQSELPYGVELERVADQPTVGQRIRSGNSSARCSKRSRSCSRCAC